ncbi:MAG: CDP-glucose 4,6-dehydratase [Lachnospiraceae bacterium]|nr:CDP-glucose 4,6-dehydratase [Lachnospiraceae bacterium]
MNDIRDFYKSKKVLITGHTGFKGAWMCEELIKLGAEVIGYALNPPTDPSLFDLCGLKARIVSIEGDIRDFDHLKSVFDVYKPEIVIHMAAQPLVRESYKNPSYTYEVNVMGTVNILECIRLTDCVKSFVNVTTDKVYLNRELNDAFKEDEMLCGFDPYSNSKSCSELVTYSYKNSFFAKNGNNEEGYTTAITTCRAGNVLGGGDFATDRIIPDCIRAVSEGKEIIVRNPYSTRPYQHVLEPVTAYLIIAMEQYLDIKKAGNYNIGPDDADCVCTGDLVNLFCERWNKAIENKKFSFNKAIRVDRFDNGPHEANFLKLDSSLVHKTFGFNNVWHIDEVMDRIVEWSISYLSNDNYQMVMEKQIDDYINRLYE